jgi:ribose transport system permease protein
VTVVTRYPARVRLRYFALQNVPLLLSLGTFAAMVVLYCVLFTLKQSRLPGSFELLTTVNNTLSVGFVAVGQTFVVLTGGIDLSVGGIVDVTNSVAARYMQDTPFSIVLVSGAALAVGALAGLLNGLLVVYGRLQPIIVTLATLAIWEGIALLVLPQQGGTIPPVLTALLAGTFPLVPWMPNSIILVLLLVAGWQLLRATRFLTGVYAIGNDERAARANGISVARAKLGAYALAGTCAGAAGLYFAAANTSGDATSGTPFTLTSIAAVVLGGVSLFGGRGSAIGSLAGAFILTLLLNVLFFAGVNTQLQEFFQGLFLILAVIAGTLVRRSLQRVR